jgi:plasmid stabilization system protein ParE
MNEYSVAFSEEAKEDLERLHAFYVRTNPQLADRALDTILSVFETLQRHPYICRKADGGALGPLWRELLISFGASGYVALFQIQGDSSILVAAVRSQRESDYH